MHFSGKYAIFVNKIAEKTQKNRLKSQKWRFCPVFILKIVDKMHKNKADCEKQPAFCYLTMNLNERPFLKTI